MYRGNSYDNYSVDRDEELYLDVYCPEAITCRTAIRLAQKQFDGLYFDGSCLMPCKPVLGCGPLPELYDGCCGISWQASFGQQMYLKFYEDIKEKFGDLADE
jgi:hypothetical protein